MDEQNLIRQCIRRDETAFVQLVDRYKVMVYNIVDRMVPNSDLTEDLAQEVFLRVYEGLPSFRAESKLSTWIYRIAYRVCLEELRRSHRRQTFVYIDEEHEVGSRIKTGVQLRIIDKAYEQADLREAVDRWLGRLPPHYRMSLNLYYLCDMTYSEIAEVMELPIGTVKTYLYRAKQRLKEGILSEQEGK